MGSAYRIESIELEEGFRAHAIAKEGEPCFLEDLASNGKTRRRATMILRMALKVARNGTEWAICAEKLKSVTPTVSVFELRADGKVLRVMTYVHDDEERTPVYLFDFDGHQGKTGKIKASVLEKAKRLAIAARECMGGQGRDNHD